MSERKLKLLLFKLRILAVVLPVLLLTLSLLSFTASRHMAGDLWQQLGCSQSQGNEGIKRSFMQGYLYYYSGRNVKNLAAGDRLAVAKDLLAYSKSYINSDAFKTAYAQERKSACPAVPDTSTRSKEEIRKTEIAKLQKSVDDMEGSMKSMNAEMQKALKESVDIIRQSICDYSKPDNEMIEAMYQNELQSKKEDWNRYQKDIAKWREEYPDNPQMLIRKRLQAFIDLSATVDFNAALKESGGKKRFVNPAYEAKSTEWKQIFRAGKEITEMAREFAKKWIKESEE